MNPDEERLTINWFWRKEVFDFDEVLITDANDEEIWAFIQKVLNDSDTSRHAHIYSLPVYLSPHLHLTDARLNLLKDTFKNIEMMVKED
jgi:hypothetical protein